MANPVRGTAQRPARRAAILLVLALALLPSAAASEGATFDAKMDRLEGGRIAVAELRGTPVLLKLWATWCLPCVEQGRVLHELREELDARGVTVLAVAVGERKEVVQRFVSESPSEFPVVLDRPQVVPRRLDIGELPALVLLRSDGTVAAVRLGLSQREDVLDLLALVD
jgi:thiol-disulfide isomerase/thioredoxin